MTFVIISAILWVICIVAFNVSLKKRPNVWYTNSAKNWKYKLVSFLLGLSAPVILMWFGILMGNKEEVQKEKELTADIEMREQRYAALDSVILTKFEEIGMYAKDVPSYDQVSPHFKIQLLENGIPHQSKIIAFYINKDGAQKRWIPLNETLVECGNYCDNPDSIDYVICISSTENTVFYGQGKRNSSTTELSFVQVFDFETNTIVDTLHFDKNKNPESIHSKGGQRVNLYYNVQPEEIIARLFK
ncbi:MAG: hypothetical protein IIY87_07185 [Bacteroidales bacterium]|nr:hypothetical protein [Bacteroidales bacterium]